MSWFKNSSFPLTVLGLSLLCAPVAAQAAVELTCSTVMMETHPVMTSSLLPFFKEWSKLSGGEVNVTYFNPGTIVASNELISATEKAVISFSMAPTGSSPAVFPVSMAVDIPLLFTNARAASLTGVNMLKTSAQFAEEYDKFKVITFNTSSPRQILSVRKPIRTLEDLKGLKISTSSASGGEMLTALGAIPVVLSLNDTYLGLQRGMVDAACLPIPTYRSTKVTEVAKYLTMCNLNPSPTPLLLNRKVYDGLPAKAKAELDKVAGEPMTILFSSMSDYFTQADLEWVIKNHKVQVIELEDAELERWRTAVQPTHALWAERAERQGVENPMPILEEMKAYATKFNDKALQLQILESNKEVLGALYPTDEQMAVIKALSQD